LIETLKFTTQRKVIGKEGKHNLSKEVEREQTKEKLTKRKKLSPLTQYETVMKRIF
jgi:hypothetical protein